MSSTCRKHQNPDSSTELPSKLAVYGPADHEFPSALEAAEFYMDAYWKGWRSGRAFLVPTIFKWHNPDVSDASIRTTSEKLPPKETGEYDKMNRVIIDDQSSKGEHIVFQAFERFQQDSLGHSIMCVHSLAINNCIPNLLPVQFEKPIDGEFDFVIIGRQIGLLIIEVKSSEFTGGKHFSPKHWSLPDQFNHGIKQLAKSDLLIRIFQNCGAEVLFPVRKVLFLPNLEKRRYEEWMKNLKVTKPESYGRVVSNVGDTIVWFKEDMINDLPPETMAVTTPLFSKIHHLLTDTSNLNSNSNSMSQSTYETCLKVLFAMKSMSKPRERLQMDMEILCPLEAILREDERIEQHNPKNKKQLHDRTSLRTPATPMKSSIFFLTKEQLDALNGPNRQMIIGPAGTGKTVVLQEKILQLLDRGEKCMIIVPESIYKEYDMTMRRHNYEEGKHYAIHVLSLDKNVEIRYKLSTIVLKYAWEKREVSAILATRRLLLAEYEARKEEDFPNNKILDTIDLYTNHALEKGDTMMAMLIGSLKEFLLNFKEDSTLRSALQVFWGQENCQFATEDEGNELEILVSFFQRVIKDKISDLLEVMPWLKECDHIFIDDFLDEEMTRLRNPQKFMIVIVFFIEMARWVNPNGVLWLAMDPYNGKLAYVSKEIVSQMKEGLQTVRIGKDEHGQEYERISAIVLRQVMRCSAHIFQECYVDDGASGDGSIEKWEEVLRPEAGHKILGMLPINKCLHFPNRAEAEEKLMQEIQKIVQHLIDIGCDSEHFAIILGSDQKGDRSIGDYWRGKFREMEEKCDGIDWMAIMERVRMWDDVSSLEWPIVIYANVLPRNEHMDRRYQRYRGRTRAKVFLATFDFTYTPEIQTKVEGMVEEDLD